MAAPFFKSPSFYLTLVVIILAVLLISEIGFKQVEGPDLEASSTHRAGPTRAIPFSPELWKSNPEQPRSILRGMEAFYHTSKFAPEYVGDALSCTQCHYAGGRQLGMLGLIGIAPLYPRYDSRNEKTISLTERLQSCFLRSENGKAPPPEDPVLRNLLDYVTALSTGERGVKQEVPYDFVTIAKPDLIPIENLSPERGQALYRQKCAACHMDSGQGDQWAPPLWGEKSFNDGAGLARVYTLASFIREAMPHSAPTSRSAEDAQQIAAFINAHERPAFAGKAQDYPSGKIPVDAVYYTRRYPQNPLKLKLGN